MGAQSLVLPIDVQYTLVLLQVGEVFVDDEVRRALEANDVAAFFWDYLFELILSHRVVLVDLLLGLSRVTLPAPRELITILFRLFSRKKLSRNSFLKLQRCCLLFET